LRRLEVVDARPPNFEAIKAVLPGAEGAGVMFAYGGKVYAPGKKSIPIELNAHEVVHIERQGDDPDGWWEKYLTDATFRFQEELLAYREQYRAYCKRHLCPMKRARELMKIAGMLAGPLYGGLMRVQDARDAILAV
jgi:hypothetical protein